MIKAQNDIETKKQDVLQGLQVTNKGAAEVQVKKVAIDKEESKKLPKLPESKIKGIYKEKCKCNQCLKEDAKDYTIKEWVNINIDDYNQILIIQLFALHIVASFQVKYLQLVIIIEFVLFYHLHLVDPKLYQIQQLIQQFLIFF